MSTSYNKLLKQAADMAAAEDKGNKHPIMLLIDYIQSKGGLNNLNRLPHTSTIQDDGSFKISFDVPSEADQQKAQMEQRAIELAAEQQRQQGTGAPSSALQMPSQKSKNVTPMNPPGQDQGMAAAANSKIEVKVAMGDDEGAKFLKNKFPDSFLKAMGL